ncbi:hypothetical protein [Vallitalea guaymasensis]|uniref:hypothetical protein n=1 Tax=Vallitalea guaymasensis TaxID=1185412 RepID=UPI000DE27B82|nr:hypothetical protein [Vallitalea guaymasensis]
MKKYLIPISVIALLVLVVVCKDNLFAEQNKNENNQHVITDETPKNTVNTNIEENIDKNSNVINSEKEKLQDLKNNETETMIEELALANGNKAQLLYNGDVLLRVNEKEIVVNSYVTDEMLFSNGITPNVEFTLQQVNDNKLLAITEYNPNMRYIEVIQRIYEIKEGSLHEFWKLESIDLDLLKVDKDIIEIGCSLTSNTIKLELTESEGQVVSQQLNDIQATFEENNLSMDELFWDNIKDNLITAITGCNWLDIDQDGDKEMIVSIYCYTVGASTPVHLREKGIMIYDLGETIELREIIFERDNKVDILEQYFIGER